LSRRLPVRAYIGLGANLGDRGTALASALESLKRLPGATWVGVSSVYRTAPVDASGPDYLNAVAALDVELEPLALLGHLQGIESQAGRRRSHRNAPRELDLDLLLYGDQTIDLPTLRVPHPRLHQRAFVLVPLHELAPGLQLPGLGQLTDWLARVADQSISRCMPA
jgi:2-amino-4-hydroxy-6-hydroxymethyldihydropteridine diphosphokinase